MECVYAFPVQSLASLHLTIPNPFECATDWSALSEQKLDDLFLKEGPYLRCGSKS